MFYLLLFACYLEGSDMNMMGFQDLYGKTIYSKNNTTLVLFAFTFLYFVERLGASCIKVFRVRPISQPPPSKTRLQIKYLCLGLMPI